MASPTGSTCKDFFSGTMRPASTAPSATPKATMPCRMAAWLSGIPRLCSAHLSTMNCRVAPAPQKSVVTASEICPSLSRHKVVKHWAKSLIITTGLRDCWW